MHVELNPRPSWKTIDHLFIVAAEGGRPDIDIKFPAELSRIIERTFTRCRFEGRSDELITVATDTNPGKVTLAGIGKEEQISTRGVRAALRTIAKTAAKSRDARIAILFSYQLPNLDEEQSVRLLSDLVQLSDYRYSPYVTIRKDYDEPRKVSCVLIPPSSLSSRALRAVSERARAIADAVTTVRDLGNAPPNELTPTVLAERASSMCKSAGVKCSVFDKKKIQKLKMGGLLAVNQGSNEEPRFVVMEYSPVRSTKTVCLVGKGITFDSGGISIKPAEKMEEMKFDMCGAAAVIGIIQAAASLQLPVKVVGLFAATENLPGGRAYKPGDIVTTMSGKTVEIVNTDAEGRMILADALHYAARFKADYLIDFATLTGACVVALGTEASGLFTSDEDLAQKLITAGQQVGEPLWRLPEWDEYKDYIRSEWADMKNSGGRYGGAVTAALFLKQFVDGASWAHLDIAGTASNDSETPRDPRGATGVGVRATIRFLESL